MNTGANCLYSRNSRDLHRSSGGITSIPFRLAISVIILSLVMPICAECLVNGTHEISRMAAISISEDISRAAVELANGRLGESRSIGISDRVDLLDFHTTIRVGDNPAGRYGTTIICSDKTGWTFTITMRVEDELECVCSDELNTFEIVNGCGDLILTKGWVDDLVCVWVVEA